VLDNRGRRWSAETIRRHAEQFSEPVFHERLREAVADLSPMGVRQTV
jgi:hypothetical protein